MKATHERLRESKRDRVVLFNFLYKDREARIEQVFECDDQTAALRKSMRALAAHYRAHADGSVARAECARDAHQECADTRPRPRWLSAAAAPSVARVAAEADPTAA